MRKQTNPAQVRIFIVLRTTFFGIEKIFFAYKNITIYSNLEYIGN